jgi:hypothetical protein
VNGVTITGSGSFGSQTTSTINGLAGSYVFANVPNAANYSLTPGDSTANYSFVASPTPASGTVTGNVTQNFTATFIGWSIIGNAGMAGVTINASWSGGDLTPQVSGSDGSFAFTGLANGTYLLTPSLSGYSFSPFYQSVVINGADGTATFVPSSSSGPSRVKLSTANARKTPAVIHLIFSNTLKAQIAENPAHYAVTDKDGRIVPILTVGYSTTGSVVTLGVSLTGSTPPLLVRWAGLEDSGSNLLNSGATTVSPQ